MNSLLLVRRAAAVSARHHHYYYATTTSAATICRPFSSSAVVTGPSSATASSSSNRNRLISRHHDQHQQQFRSFASAAAAAHHHEPSLTITHMPLPLTKIVATIGPTSEQAEPLLKVTNAGMKIMRLNFSHATPEEVQLRVTNLQAAQQALTPDGMSTTQETRAILLDTKGPEIRTGKLACDDSGHETVPLEAGAAITLMTDPAWQETNGGSTATHLFVDYPTLHNAVQPGMKVLLDDGAVVLTVESCDSSNGQVTCMIDNSGAIRSRAGVNLPGADTTDLPAMSDKDRADIVYGMQHADIDYVAASFIQTASGVEAIRQHIATTAYETLGWSKGTPLPLIISKIETQTGLDHFDDILEASDGIMVARGDLGVEIPLSRVVLAQKDMVARCIQRGKPVIVATQMLESMSKNPRPTRAEVADVTNAVLEGADAVMTSGETAKGKYPDTTISMMTEICTHSEQYSSEKKTEVEIKDTFAGPQTRESAIAKAAVAAAEEHGPEGRQCTAILCLVHEGNLARLLAAYRPTMPILAYCPTAKIARQLQIHRGVYPIINAVENGSSVRVSQQNNTDVNEYAMNVAKTMGYVEAGDEVVIVGMDDRHANGSNSLDDMTNNTAATMTIATVP